MGSQSYKQNKPNQTAKRSLERKWMKSVLGLNVLLKNPLDALQTTMGFTV
jgi:hypothetical protein